MIIDLPDDLVAAYRVASASPISQVVSDEAQADTAAGTSPKQELGTQDDTLLRWIAELCLQISEQNRLSHQMISRQLDDQIQSAKVQQSVLQTLELLVTARTRPAWWQDRVNELLELLERIRRVVTSAVTHHGPSQIERAPNG